MYIYAGHEVGIYTDQCISICIYVGVNIYTPYVSTYYKKATITTRKKRMFYVFGKFLDLLACLNTLLGAPQPHPSKVFQVHGVHAIASYVN